MLARKMAIYYGLDFSNNFKNEIRYLYNKFNLK